MGLIAASVYVFVSAAYHGELETLVKNEYAPGGLDLALSTAVQNGCFVFLVCVLAALLPIDPPWTVTAPRRIQVIERIGHALAWRGAHTSHWLAGLVGGLTIGLVGQFIVSALQALNFPVFLGSLEIISAAILDTDGPSYMVVFLSLAIVAPVGEELLFRGYLWAVLRKVLSPMWTLALTTIAFALFHMEPIHILGLLPTALYLGWLRMRTGSIKLCIFVHAVNNGFAVILGRLAGSEAQLAETDPSLLAQSGLAVFGLLATVTAAQVATRFAARTSPSSDKG